MAYTRHGHHIPGTPKTEGYQRTAPIMKCGGPRGCVSCADDTQKAREK